VPFAQAAAGVIGVETMLPVALEIHHRGDAGLLDLLARMTVRPAEILGLPQGRLAKGAPADLVLFDLNRAWKIDAAMLKSKSKNSAFDGKPVEGRVLRTIVDGRIVYQADSANQR
jgi:dihydroorotase